MADRERNDLRRQIEVTRRALEANERRRALIWRERAGRGAGARWIRERPARLATIAAVVALGAAGSVAPASVTGDEPRQPSVVATDGAVRDVPAEVTVTLDLAGSDGDDEPDAEPSGDPSTEPGRESPGGGRAASPEASSSDQDAQPTADVSSEPEPATETATSSPTPEPSGTGEPDDGSTEPGPTESPEPDSPDEDTGDGTCLEVDLLGLAVDLCLPG